jgi:hypothetical protein
MSLTVKYKKGALFTYSLNAYSPYEGWRVTFVGTKGRIEAQEFSSGINQGNPIQYIKLFNRRGEMITIESKRATGGHGGGDERLRRMLFAGDLPDPLGQMAGSRAGAMSLLIGAAGNLSIAEKRPVAIEDLLQGTAAAN